MDERVEIVRTSRNGQAIVVHENHYRLIKTVNAKRYWRCSMEGCSCTAVTCDRDGNTFLSSNNGVHDHGSMEKKCNTLRVKQRMVEAVSEGHVGVKAAYDTVLQARTAGLNGEHFQEAVANHPLFESVKSAVHRAKLSAYPHLPNAVEEINLDGDLGLSINNQQFILCDDRGNSDILVFATENCLRHLSNCSTILIDGTFHVVPTMYYQLYTIHGKLKR